MTDAEKDVAHETDESGDVIHMTLIGVGLATTIDRAEVVVWLEQVSRWPNGKLRGDLPTALRALLESTE